MMISKLQKKLIVMTVLSLAVIFTVMIALMNAVSYYTTMNQISQSLEVLAGSQTEGGTAARVRENLPNVTASALYRVSNYCIIRLTRDGELYEWKSENEQLYNDAVVAQILQDVKATGADSGRVGPKVFRIVQADKGARIAIMDVSAEFESSSRFLRISASVGFLFWVILSGLAAVLIYRLVP